MIYSLFYRQNSFEFFLYSILGQLLLFKRKHRCVVPIHGHVYRKLKHEVSRTEKRLKIAIRVVGDVPERGRNGFVKGDVK